MRTRVRIPGSHIKLGCGRAPLCPGVEGEDPRSTGQPVYLKERTPDSVREPIYKMIVLTIKSNTNKINKNKESIRRISDEPLASTCGNTGKHTAHAHMHAGNSAQRQKSCPNVLPAQIGPCLPRACWLKGFTRAYTFHSPFGNPSHPPPCPAAPSLAHPPSSLAASKINFQQEQQVLSHLGLLAASPARKQLSLFAINQPPSFSAIRSRPSPQPPSCKREEEGLVLDQRDLLLRSHPLPKCVPEWGGRVRPCWPRATRHQSQATSPPVGKDGCAN